MYTNFSKKIETAGKNRYRAIIFKCKIGIILASFNESGILHIEKDKFIMFDRGTAILDFIDLRSLTDEVFFKFDIN